MSYTLTNEQMEHIKKTLDLVYDLMGPYRIVNNKIAHAWTHVDHSVRILDEVKPDKGFDHNEWFNGYL